MPIALRGLLLDFTADPSYSAGALCATDDGAVLIDAGRIVACGPYADLVGRAPPETVWHDHRGCLIAPGFVDAHLHLPQVDVIASPARGLLDWLERHTFPAELAFADPLVAADAASFFLDELARQGTTTAAVFGTVHPVSVEALMAEALARDVRLIAGKCLMDRHAPAALRDTAQGGVAASAQLADRWHGRGRLAYAITPRFAATSSPEQLQLAGALACARPQLRIQTHLAENVDEVRWVAELYPQARSYLDVYDRAGLLRAGSIYAHGIWLDAADRARLRAAGAALAVCPTSNLFLGSGLFDFAAALDAGVPLALATDVGGGQSFSMFSAMRAAHEVARLQGFGLSAAQLWFWATRGGAQALGFADCIGRLAPGYEADLVVIDPAATPLLARRSRRTADLEELLFALLVLADDRAIRATYLAGKVARPRTEPAGPAGRLLHPVALAQADR